MRRGRNAHASSSGCRIRVRLSRRRVASYATTAGYTEAVSGILARSRASLIVSRCSTAKRRDSGGRPGNTSRVPNERSEQLQDLAQRVADALPLEAAEEVVLTGSVSRGVADEVSDIEMRIATPEPIQPAGCFEHARAG